jgi:hypothetical protein
VADLVFTLDLLCTGSLAGVFDGHTSQPIDLDAPAVSVDIMITHSLADLDALATEEDRARARGFMDRSAITVLAGLPPRELARVAEITPLTGPERALVASWSAPTPTRPAPATRAAGST